MLRVLLMVTFMSVPSAFAHYKNLDVLDTLSMTESAKCTTLGQPQRIKTTFTAMGVIQNYRPSESRVLKLNHETL
jgi:hypothetical protein